MLDRATRRAKSWADMQRPSPAGFIGRSADRHTADPDNLEHAFLEIPNFVGLLEPLQDHIYILSYRRVVAICSRRRYQFLDIAQPVLSEKDLVADKEGGRAESTARYRTLRIVEQPHLDLGVLDQVARSGRHRSRIRARRRAIPPDRRAFSVPTTYAGRSRRHSARTRREAAPR